MSKVVSITGGEFAFPSDAIEDQSGLRAQSCERASYFDQRIKIMETQISCFTVEIGRTSGAGYRSDRLVQAFHERAVNISNQVIKLDEDYKRSKFRFAAAGTEKKLLALKADVEELFETIAQPEL